MIQEEKNWFYNICRINGLSLNDKQIEQMDTYVGLLLDWNKKINLISRKDEENVWSYHILHSVSLLFRLHIKENSSIIDIGTGGGLPGVPIKILRPDLSIVCLDSKIKKVNALLQMTSKLELGDINILCGRAEEIGRQPEYMNKFDVAVARAVAPLVELIPWAKNFVKTKDHKTGTVDMKAGGQIMVNSPAFLALKGGDLSEEIEKAKRKYLKINIQSIDLAFEGSEKLIDSQKQILIVHF